LRRPTRLDAALVRVLIGCMFVRVVTELETCYIYEAVLHTIKVAVRNLAGASNFISQYSKLDVGLLLHERA
jgi:hypothetical protein